MSDMFGVGTAVQAGTSLAAAGMQSAAINRATDAQSRAAQNSLDFARQQYSQQQGQEQPFYDVGHAALDQLGNNLWNGNLANVNPGNTSYVSPGNATDIQYQNQGPMQAGSIQAGSLQSPGSLNVGQFDPNTVNVSQDPGYQFRLQQGMQALQRSQAATGISGGAAAKAINDYAQGTASQEYGNAYQRALGTYQTNAQTQAQNYSASNQAQQNAFQLNNQAQQGAFQLNNQAQQGAYQLNNANNQNAFNDQMAAYQAQAGNNLNVANSALQNQSNAFNRLYSVAGIGQNAAANMGAAGQAATQQQSSINSQLGNALSAGSAAQGNVWSNAVNQSGNALNSYILNKGGVS